MALWWCVPWRARSCRNGYSDRLFKEKITLWEHEAFVDKKPVSVTGLLEAVSLLLFGHTHGPETEPRMSLAEAKTNQQRGCT